MPDIFPYDCADCLKCFKTSPHGQWMGVSAKAARSGGKNTQAQMRCVQRVGSVIRKPPKISDKDDAGVAGRARALERFSYAVAGLLVCDNFEAPCDCTESTKRAWVLWGSGNSADSADGGCRRSGCTAHAQERNKRRKNKSAFSWSVSSWATIVKNSATRK